MVNYGNPAILFMAACLNRRVRLCHLLRFHGLWVRIWYQTASASGHEVGVVVRHEDLGRRINRLGPAKTSPDLGTQHFVS